MFIKLEDYDKYGDNPDYQFAYSKTFKTEFIPKEDFDKGYVLDWSIRRAKNKPIIFYNLNQLLFISLLSYESK